MRHTNPNQHNFTEGGAYRNRRTGVIIRIERLFESGGELIADSVVIDGPHSIGCRFQHRPNYGVSELEAVAR